jgi:hypothetical protein
MLKNNFVQALVTSLSLHLPLPSDSTAPKPNLQNVEEQFLYFYSFNVCAEDGFLLA